jgi:hypothetical protein
VARAGRELASVLGQEFAAGTTALAQSLRLDGAPGPTRGAANGDGQARDGGTAKAIERGTTDDSTDGRRAGAA